MSFGFSIGDIILCTQIAHRLFSSVTKGRKNAPRDLKELEDALLGLCYTLDLLQINHKVIIDNATSKPNVVAAHMNMDLGYMLKSCQETLTELDNATAKYRESANDLPHTVAHDDHVIAIARMPPPQLFRAQVRIQWKRIMWDLRGDSLTKYRQKLQSHTNSISVLLSIFIWSVLCLPS